MQQFKEVLAKRIYELKQIIQKEEKRLKKIPEGSVQVTGTEKKVMFYIQTIPKMKMRTLIFFLQYMTKTGISSQ